MDSHADQQLVGLIGDCFRPRLKRLINVETVLDYVTFIGRDDKEVIINKSRTASNQQAVDDLIDVIMKGPRPAGWAREFITALEASGCQHAAMYMDAEHLPSPTVEAENEACVAIITLLLPSIKEMKTTDVCYYCHALDILTMEERDTVETETRNKGNISGARLLITKITQKPPGWFSTFLKVLEKTEHFSIIRELTGADDHQDVLEGSGKPVIQKNHVLEKQDSRPEVAVSVIKLGDNVGEATNCTSNGEETLETSMGESTLLSSLENSLNTTDSDLYSDAEPAGEVENSDADSHQDGAAAASDSDIDLRSYQMDVAKPALEGRNSIICLPTGSGKTRVAVYITKKHLERRKSENLLGKVVVLVNKVPLVEQHYTTEFGLFLRSQCRVERVSGDSQLKISFPDIVKKNDIVICTAQILENFLDKAKKGEDEGVCLSDFSLLVIDECHHTQKGEVYNHIMIRYLKQKNKNEQLRKEQKPIVPLPQVLGLTASPGVGGARNQQKAMEHILKICANLDAYEIKTAQLGEHMKEPYKKIATAEERKEDPFGDMIKSIMKDIHAHADLQPSCVLGTQNYEQWVVQKEQNAAKEENQKVRVCAEHLRQYNEALNQSNTIRMSDAFNFLNKYYEEETEKKTAPVEEGAIKITDTERFLFNLFKDNKKKLQDWAKHPEYENKSLSKLKTVILQEFTSRSETRGIIFTETRLSAIALSQWIQENRKFEEVGVRGSYLIGGGDQSVVKPMTTKEQKEVLGKFRTGEINLLIATSVAEEGLDIRECNVVIRYCLVTNEIAMIQARGRGRAEDSSYILIEAEGSGVAERETTNEYREKMMSKAIEKIQNLNRKEYENRKMEFQIQTVMEDRVRAKKARQKQMKTEDPDKVKFSCRNCSKFVCSGKNIEKMAHIHHVNVSDEFRELFIVRGNTALQERQLDCEMNGTIACKDCGYTWGSMMLHRGIDCPCLNIKQFLITFDNKQKVYDKWNDLAFRFPQFDYVQHAHLFDEGSDSE